MAKSFCPAAFAASSAFSAALTASANCPFAALAAGLYSSPKLWREGSALWSVTRRKRFRCVA